MKSLGIGISLSLNRLECHIYSAISNSAVVCDTEMWIDGDIDSAASFEESLLDDRHLVTVCLKQVRSKNLHRYVACSSQVNLLIAEIHVIIFSAVSNQ